MSDVTKASTGVGVVLIVVGAVFLLLDSGAWALDTYLILFGVYCVLNGVSSILSGIGQKVTRRLSFGFWGVGLVFLGIALATRF